LGRRSGGGNEEPATTAAIMNAHRLGCGLHFM
jgi:hypothetical protein